MRKSQWVNQQLVQTNHLWCNPSTKFVFFTNFSIFHYDCYCDFFLFDYHCRIICLCIFLLPITETIIACHMKISTHFSTKWNSNEAHSEEFFCEHLLAWNIPSLETFPWKKYVFTRCRLMTSSLDAIRLGGNRDDRKRKIYGRHNGRYQYINMLHANF